MQCRACGGTFGDPYNGMVIKNGFFSIRHYGGSTGKWTRIITFKWNKEISQFELHRDAGINYSVFDPENTTEVVYDRQKPGRILFTEYRNDAR